MSYLYWQPSEIFDAHKNVNFVCIDHPMIIHVQLRSVWSDILNIPPIRVICFKHFPLRVLCFKHSPLGSYFLNIHSPLGSYVLTMLFLKDINV